MKEFELLSKIGNTKIKEIEENLFVKFEGTNPSGSIKDRAARQMIIDLFEEGKINKSSKLVEATSGNTGIGLAYVTQLLHMSLTICMPSNMSKERIALMKKYGAEIILTDASLGMAGSIAKAKELEKDGYYYIDQFNNYSNVRAHLLTTGPEIDAYFKGDLDIFVAGVGTAGTLIGVGTYLKNKYPNIKIIGVEPSESAVLSGEEKGSHKIQGIGAGFIPSLYNKDIVDEVIKIKSDDAIEEVKRLYKKDIFVGISSGANVLAAKELKKHYPNKKILTISPDFGDKYISLGIYEK